MMTSDLIINILGFKMVLYVYGVQIVIYNYCMLIHVHDSSYLVSFFHIYKGTDMTVDIGYLSLVIGSKCFQRRPIPLVKCYSVLLVFKQKVPANLVHLTWERVSQVRSAMVLTSKLKIFIVASFWTWSRRFLSFVLPDSGSTTILYLSFNPHIGTLTSRYLIWYAI